MKYYGYGESSSKTKWDYYNDKFKYPSMEDLEKGPYADRGDINIRYVGFCNKKDMINIVGEIINSKNWVKERICETCNNEEIELCKKYLGYIVVYNTRTKEVIELLPLGKINK
jgi:hypothetical protein